MKTVFASVVYPQALPFLSEFFSSLQAQDDNDFDVLLINDGIMPEILWSEIEAYPGLRKKTNVIQAAQGLMPCTLRVQLMQQAYARQYRLMIMGDCDDSFSHDRIRGYKEAYASDSAFWYNNLLSWDGSAVMPPMPLSTKNFRDIGEHNYIGLGNSGINLAAVEDSFIESLYGVKTDTFDWYLFTRMLLAGKTGRKTLFGTTFYRIHPGNTAGLHTYSISSLKHEIEIKMQHYKNLINYNSYFEEKYHQYAMLEHAISREEKESWFWWGLLHFGDV